MFHTCLLTLASLAAFSSASYYDAVEEEWNLNANKNAATPLEYSIPDWPAGFQHQPSPENWRFPFYSFFLDRFVNGDPTNDNANGTTWEQDPKQTQLRHGGDIKGLQDSLDYLHGLGIRGLYLVGSAMLNLPWEADGYSPQDHTILDHHLGNIQEWRAAIKAIHDKGMYVILDNTMATMSNQFGFEGYYNTSADWSFTEHKMNYISGFKYRDFYQTNNFEDECSYEYPRFWDQGGRQIIDNNTASMKGCMDSEFDQFGDVGAFGIYPEWQKQLSKFNGVQDRLREWRPQVLDKIKHFSCMMIQGLDIDGFRIDKAMQVTVDPQGNWSAYQRECAQQVGKNNFFIPGEIVNGNADGSIYLGRGKEPRMQIYNVTEAMSTNDSEYIRADGYQALDAGAFHYSTYRALMRFLGLDGNLLASNDAPVNFADQWEVFVQTNDMNNAITGKFDPRHMYGVSNHDVLRWPGLTNGTERQLLGDFVITMLMPGIPMVSWGEEQAFYVLDNTAANYIYGRQPMSSAQAWQMHGCYKVGNQNLNNWPVNSSLVGCQDDGVSLDHRDSTHPVYTVLKQMFEMRNRYPVLTDGFNVQQLSNQTFNYTLPGSYGVPTETGLWSVVRTRVETLQDFEGEGMFGNQPIWLLYSNYNGSTTYTSDCQSDDAIISPFDAGTTVKNMFYPFEEWDLEESPVTLGIEGSTKPNGCLSKLNMTLYGWKAFVPKDNWIAPSPVLTGFSPGHDARILSNSTGTQPSTVDIEFRFSTEMDCQSLKDSITVNSTTESGRQGEISQDSIECLTIDPQFEAYYYGPSPSIWRARATLSNMYDGVHMIHVNNVSASSGNASTNSNDHFMIRLGKEDNPIVFPTSANFSTTLLYKATSSKRDASITSSGLMINHKAPGADKWRFSMSFGAIWSEWFDYTPGNATLPSQTWSGSDYQKWTGDHVQVQYWSQLAGSSDHVVEGDLVGSNVPPRRFPHLFVHGSFNQYGFDSGLPNDMSQLDNGTWMFDFMDEWPTQFQLNVWGMAANGEPDVSFAMGDVDNDTVLDRISPVSLQQCVVNITNKGPDAPYLAWRILFNDADFRYYLVPVGNRYTQLVLWILLGLVPVITAGLGVWAYMHFFYGVKFNKIGLSEKKSILPIGAVSKVFHREKIDEKDEELATPLPPSMPSQDAVIPGTFGAGATIESKRRTVLIATMEYDISDWSIKVKIGGLGVMAQLMGKNLEHQDLIWVVPCAGGVEYPVDTPGLPIDVTILGRTYEVQVQYHKLNNITYMLLDAPVFRRQSTKEPYPARMDDLDSAIYYSAWNQCIAEAMRRFPIDLYHINDYHGTVAPLYLLPDTIPCCLSLHNAEFQGLWPMRNPREVEEICSVFNLPHKVVERYVQFGEVFNLLHAGASILRIHQKGFGAVGVSKKYGKRSWARYPIFWGLKKIGALPNPDPSDVAEWDKKLANPDDIQVDQVFESGRAGLKRQAQEWAGLEQRADADLFVFVGRWSMQKGIDLIADVFPAVLEQFEHVQLLCVGPTIDLYGKFAALKLDKMMQKYPGRVYSKPEFTALPPFIFSGAEFALIPSRDEPFGLVAVEFGRKGALGVGSRVGGLGQMPGWWYTIESSTTKHQMHQFKMAIAGALKSDYETRALMRARSAKQRFPVAQWKEDLEILQGTSIKIHKKQMERISARRMGLDDKSGASSGWNTPGWMTPRSGWATPTGSRPGTRPSSPTRSGTTTPSGSRHGSLSLGMRHGPGHSPPQTISSSRSGSSQRPETSRRNSVEDQAAERRRLSSIEDEEYISAQAAEESKRRSQLGNTINEMNYGLRDGTRNNNNNEPSPPERAHNPYFSASPSTPGGADTPSGQQFPFLARPHTPVREDAPSIPQTPLSTEKVMDEKKDQPQDLTPFFTDPTGLYFKTFEKKLDTLNGKNSESALCIEEYLEKSEKQWFHRLHEAKMSRANSPTASKFATPAGSIYEGVDTDESLAQFLLPANYKAPTGIRRLMLYKVGDWPVYSLLLALGQILAANSYQITLISGQIGQTAGQLYAIACIYLATTLIWWFLFRRLASIYVLSMPWIFYGLAFWLLAFAPYGQTESARGWVQNVATAMYAVASSSGSLFFAQNFGSLGSAPVKDWAFRACAIQGTQQLYVVGLWAWGSKLTAMNNQGEATSLGSKMTAIGIPISLFLWAVGLVLFFGLPDFYRQKPGAVPDFYSSIFRRKIIVWFLLAVFIQNIFLSAPYGRNWSYLWSSKAAPGWAIFLLIVLFFVAVWALVLWFFGHLSTTHSWIIPIFAIGLGAPRWCQILWATSNIGQYLPWAGGPVASAVLGRALWLWLGVLDSVQGIGFGMILLQTMVRFHCSFVLMAGQCIGAIATIIARADGLNSIGPGPTFPNFAGGWSEGLAQPWFWIGLLFQLGICVGFFTFFRKEQLTKP
ncbi:glycosyltransferase family 5 protein [Zasmidium cellare ATCC 36951]|uniref:alpha-1,3-glucan synthase n=1 Tax=Zasmidium cellare ATCC 36951 TaxID=1080233 RepID=A0A6A6C864_ZASCE|nr:glycosyltransferase family 5 protein [Zasmidium cellare ATCC 36951]KAF2163334.1 glycosyltransferase family 5 protein [Zasmidium cellare ATCC 36951]